MDISETDCCPDEWYLTPKKKVNKFILKETIETAKNFKFSLFISFNVKGTGNRGKENRINKRNKGTFIVWLEKIDKIDVKNDENPLNGVSIE